MTQRRLANLIVFVAITFATASSEPAVAAQRKLEKTTVVYREIDGHKILADVFRPPGDDVKPVVVWLHGGALIMGHREAISGQVRKVAEEKGYALVSFDYRLAPETKLPGIISDIEAAFRWLGGEGAKRFHLDPQRIVVTGGSAGGYLTLVTGYRVTPKPKALIAFWGYGDLIGDWYSQPSPHPRHNPRKITREEALQQTDGSVVSDSRKRKGNGGTFYLYCRQTGTWPKAVSGFDPKTEADKIASFEPVRNVDENFPPTLLIHGTKDTDVPYEESVMMVQQFKRHGVPYTLISIDNGEHGLGGGDRDAIDAAYREARDFIIRHLEQAP